MLSLVSNIAVLTAHEEQERKHDRFCLICVELAPDYECYTCQRAYHKPCLHPRHRQKGPATRIATTTARVHIPTRPALPWCCPLCRKRTWNAIPPKDALTRRRIVEKDERGLLLQKKLKKEPKQAVALTWTDNGTRESDLKLLYRLDAIDEQRLQNAVYVDKDFGMSYGLQSASGRESSID